MREKTDYITFLSVISAIAVVFLHTNGVFWEYSTDAYWASANFIESIFYFAVPVFFMISGATLVDYKERYSTKEFFKKRFWKTVFPFLIWNFIGLIFNMVTGQIIKSDITWKYIVNGITSSPYISVYWFFIQLFCVYLSIPLFASVEKSNRKSLFIYLAVAGFVMETLIPFINNIFAFDINWSISVSVVGGYLIFIPIGYLLYSYDIPKIIMYIIYVLGLLGLLLHICGTYTLSRAVGDIVEAYKGYTNLPSIIYAVGIFTFGKQFGNKIMKTRCGSLINFLGEYTFAIYLIHIYIMVIIQKVFEIFFDISCQTLLYRLSAPVIIVILAVLIVWFIRKIAVLKKIVP